MYITKQKNQQQDCLPMYNKHLDSTLNLDSCNLTTSEACVTLSHLLLENKPANLVELELILVILGLQHTAGVATAV